jgi:hypothetical protein
MTTLSSNTLKVKMLSKFSVLNCFRFPPQHALSLTRCRFFGSLPIRSLPSSTKCFYVILQLYGASHTHTLTYYFKTFSIVRNFRKHSQVEKDMTEEKAEGRISYVCKKFNSRDFFSSSTSFPTITLTYTHFLAFSLSRTS